MKVMRDSLDKIDNEMRRLFEERLNIVKEIALYKFDNDLQVYDSQREQAIIDSNLSKLNNTDYSQYYEDFIKFQMNISKDLQEKIINQQEK